MASKSNLSVVIDIGTSKIVSIAGSKNEYGKVEADMIGNIFTKEPVTKKNNNTGEKDDKRKKISEA